MAVLVLADHDEGRLSPATARIVAAAGKLGGPIDVLVAGEGVAAIAAAAGSQPPTALSSRALRRWGAT
jgi:electron transfer flavoprotein alpha subunit